MIRHETIPSVFYEIVHEMTYDVRENGKDLTQSFDKSPYTNGKFQKAKSQHKNATKITDYTTIEVRL